MTSSCLAGSRAHWLIWKFIFHFSGRQTIIPMSFANLCKTFFSESIQIAAQRSSLKYWWGQFCQPSIPPKPWLQCCAVCVWDVAAEAAASRYWTLQCWSHWTLQCWSHWTLQCFSQWTLQCWSHWTLQCLSHWTDDLLESWPNSKSVHKLNW